jgi:hypothetical protein
MAAARRTTALVRRIITLALTACFFALPNETVDHPRVIEATPVGIAHRCKDALFLELNEP